MNYEIWKMNEEALNEKEYNVWIHGTDEEIDAEIDRIEKAKDEEEWTDPAGGIHVGFEDPSKNYE